jgi:hypothetical protein
MVPFVSMMGTEPRRAESGIRVSFPRWSPSHQNVRSIGPSAPLVEVEGGGYHATERLLLLVQEHADLLLPGPW